MAMVYEALLGYSDLWWRENRKSDRKSSNSESREVIGVEVFQVDVDVIQPFVFLGIGRCHILTKRIMIYGVRKPVGMSSWCNDRTLTRLNQSQREFVRVGFFRWRYDRDRMVRKRKEIDRDL